MSEPAFDYGEFSKLVPLLITHDRLRAALYVTDDLVWLLPADVLPGVTEAYGLPVIRLDVPRPMLAHDPLRTELDQPAAEETP